MSVNVVLSRLQLLNRELKEPNIAKEESRVGPEVEKPQQMPPSQNQLHQSQNDVPAAAPVKPQPGQTAPTGNNSMLGGWGPLIHPPLPSGNSSHLRSLSQCGSLLPSVA